MKPLRDLTLDDLARTPVWRYHGAQDNGALVEPTDLQEVSENGIQWDPASERWMGPFIIRTSFVLHDGSLWTGYSSPADDSGLDYVQPVIITEAGHVPMFYEEPPPEAEPEATCRKLGRSLAAIFPVWFRAEVPVDGRTVEGVVDALHVP